VALQTDAQWLERCPQLSILQLGSTPVGDDGLQRLAELRSLEVVGLSQCSRVSGSGVGEFLKAHPALTAIDTPPVDLEGFLSHLPDTMPAPLRAIVMLPAQLEAMLSSLSPSSSVQDIGAALAETEATLATRSLAELQHVLTVLAGSTAIPARAQRGGLIARIQRVQKTLRAAMEAERVVTSDRHVWNNALQGQRRSSAALDASRVFLRSGKDTRWHCIHNSCSYALTAHLGLHIEDIARVACEHATTLLARRSYPVDPGALPGEVRRVLEPLIDSSARAVLDALSGWRAPPEGVLEPPVAVDVAAELVLASRLARHNARAATLAAAATAAQKATTTALLTHAPEAPMEPAVVAPESSIQQVLSAAQSKTHSSDEWEAFSPDLARARVVKRPRSSSISDSALETPSSKLPRPSHPHALEALASSGELLDTRSTVQSASAVFPEPSERTSRFQSRLNHADDWADSARRSLEPELVDVSSPKHTPFSVGTRHSSTGGASLSRLAGRTARVIAAAGGSLHQRLQSPVRAALRASSPSRKASPDAGHALLRRDRPFSRVGALLASTLEALQSGGSALETAFLDHVAHKQAALAWVVQDLPFLSVLQVKWSVARRVLAIAFDLMTEQKASTADVALYRALRKVYTRIKDQLTRSNVLDSARAWSDSGSLELPPAVAV
jgi:hypothetical protein